MEVPFYTKAVPANVTLFHNEIKEGLSAYGAKQMLPLHFGECGVNEIAEQRITLQNNNEDLPVSFRLANIAHFNYQPNQGDIPPGEAVDISLFFIPHQQGEHYLSWRNYF